MTRDELIELIGDPETFLRNSETFRRSCDYVSEHWDELYAEYEGQWIALHDGKFIASGAEQESVLSALDAAGLPTAFSLVQYLMPHDIGVMMQCRL